MSAKPSGCIARITCARWECRYHLCCVGTPTPIALHFVVPRDALGSPSAGTSHPLHGTMSRTRLVPANLAAASVLKAGRATTDTVT